MSDPNVDRWRQTGSFAAWRNRGVWRAPWNFSADAEGCRALVELIDLMRAAKWPSRRTLSLTPVVVTGDHGGQSPFRRARAFELRYPKEQVEAGHWDLVWSDGTVTLTIGADRLDEFQAAVRDLSNGGGDYAIGDDPERLWIWWWCRQPD